MRIQHNIPAMNSLTNYTNNNNALAKNLEKLSSGYRINSAADDAAGLAISEKMRSQIKGLEQAYNNANDGISLVQVAEGALTEVNSMLTRLTELATQSANGTYEKGNEEDPAGVDRRAIQDETDAILEEIDRISQATNFNGINLLDGSLDGGGGSSAGSVARSLSASVSKAMKTAASTILSAGTSAAVSSTAATVAIGGVAAGTTALAAGDKLDVTLELTDGTQKTFSLTVTDNTTTAFKYDYTDSEGNTGSGQTTVTSNSAATATDIGGLVASLVGNDESFSETYALTNTSGLLKLTANEADYSTAGLKHISISKNGTSISELGATTTAAKVDFQNLDVTKLKIFEKGGTADAVVASDVKDAIFEVDGQKFALVKDQESANAIDPDLNINAIVVGDTTAPDATDAALIVNTLNAKLGTNIATPTTTTVELISQGSAGSSGSGGGLKLQVGDTNDEWQHVSVDIKDMSSKGIGIDGLDLTSQDSAGDSIAIIKAAVNKVSAQRGKLGALQNRLDHTLNNLDATTENITSAESQIRDVNMAKEMTAYTKNNILAQAAQSMLAQANSMPQGVLQLLQ